eukprot:sb/3473266/
MLSAMSDRQREGVAALLKAFDQNGDGKLSFEDLRAAFKMYGVEATGEEIKTLVTRFDTDGDLKLDFSEMLGLMAVLQKKGADRGQLKQIFDVMDKNGNRRINKQELQSAMALYCHVNYTDSELDDLMRKVDFDNDGFISFNEFAQSIHLFKLG